MGGYLRVEADNLGRLLRDLHNSQEWMRKALSGMKDIGPKSTGSEALDNACDEFHDSWDNAIEKIADGTGQIKDKLRATKNDYEAVEQAIRDAMHKGAAKKQGPAPSPQPRPTAGAR
ncbi:type VII secretion target [Streptomyces botrytidirepellens]|uniref:Uncharacterized protein n=1 Tax=Streptomyces botrytidirepellens TaxID=2486417 RepID=A0A3M8WU35_9ACTN|nr:type VII secretion target [Streptomyces botrytidirepellens]RNG33486.1 hypothetical protein EEJ42_07490 [Streptomyces botrytidirepellens]